MKLKAFQMWKNFDVNLNSTLCELPQYCCPISGPAKKSLANHAQCCVIISYATG